MRRLSPRAVAPPVAPRRGAAFFSVGLLLLTLVAAAVAPAPRTAHAASATTTADLNLRSGPSLSNSVILVMPWGSRVNTLGPYQNGFYQVTYNGSTGWAYGSYLSISSGTAPTPSPSPAPSTPPASGSGTGTATTTADLNLRAGPSTADYVILVIPWGSRVTLTGQSANGFASVDYNGTAGWAYSAYLTAAGGTSQPPALSPSPSPQPSSSPQPGLAPSSSPAPSTPPASGSGTAYAIYNLNFRSGPGTSYPVLNVIPVGGAVTLTGISQDGFYNVYYGGQRGWAWAAGLNVSGNAPAPSPSPSPSSSPNPGGGSGSGTGPLTEQQVIDIIYAAADRYGQPRADMLRVARCESNLDPNAVNPAGSYGLFQFIPSTWATTPYANYDIFDAWASANAAGWMWSVGRRNEWVCQ